MSELKPCPFCGGIPAVVEDGYKAIAVHCFNCGADITAESEKKARAAWNRRAQTANEPLTIEQLKQMDGEPVWVVSDRANGHRAEWKIVVHCGPNCTEWIGTESAWSNADYGKTWLAYDYKKRGDSDA